MSLIYIGIPSLTKCLLQMHNFLFLNITFVLSELIINPPNLFIVIFLFACQNHSMWERFVGFIVRVDLPTHHEKAYEFYLRKAFIIFWPVTITYSLSYHNKLFYCHIIHICVCICIYKFSHCTLTSMAFRVFNFWFWTWAMRNMIWTGDFIILSRLGWCKLWIQVA